MLVAAFSSTQAFVVAPVLTLPAARRTSSTHMTASEDAAKAAWLAKLDAPSWGLAAQAMRSIAEEAAQFQALSEECDAGDSEACGTLSKEEEAKKKWLAKIDVPSWGKAAAAMKEIGEDEVASVSSSMSEEEAKKAWLAKLDKPVWGQAAAAMTSIVAEAHYVAGLTEDANEEASEGAAAKALAKENEAKRAWLAKLDVPSWGKMSEEEAKKKWLAKLDVPSWQGKVAPTKPAAAADADSVFRMEVSEEEAKKKWLAKLDVPSWQVKRAPINEAALSR